MILKIELIKGTESAPLAFRALHFHTRLRSQKHYGQMLGIPYPGKIPSWLFHASLDSAVNRPDSKARAFQEARYKVHPGFTIHL